MHEFSEKTAKVRFWTHDPRVRGLVEKVADGVIVIDTAGRIELFNPAAERLFGFMADEVMGQDVAMLAPRGYRHLHQAGYRRAPHHWHRARGGGAVQRRQHLPHVHLGRRGQVPGLARLYRGGP